MPATSTVPGFTGMGLKFRIEKPEIVTKNYLVNSVFQIEVVPWLKLISSFLVFIHFQLLKKLLIFLFLCCGIINFSFTKVSFSKQKYFLQIQNLLRKEWGCGDNKVGYIKHYSHEIETLLNIILLNTYMKHYFIKYLQGRKPHLHFQAMEVHLEG